ncbi:sigma-70 family RNA polymerase sigma factor [Euhalothece natronophila Z-M001]|uniref:Sigma-70 family RNA polymerase sigma factor n=2 Tax=Euhalothece TaxID=65097 RepID=A0A5B8NN79_9CHRO|nr:sigma-70 family RNA polymerase sigma factor [Euhalothece natronophila Z-M001]
MVCNFLMIMVASSPVKSTANSYESELLARFFAGNQQAYWQLWKLYEAEIYRYCLVWMENNVEEAEDLKQEIMCQGFSKLSQYRERLTSLRSLFMTMTRNRCRDVSRRKRAIRYFTLEGNENYPNQQLSPEEVAVREEIRESLESAIAQLPPSQSYVIRHYYLKAIPHGKIAKVLNIKPATSRKHAEKGLKKLRLIMTT